MAKRIAWIDSSDMSSRIHLTDDGNETLCGGHSEYISGRRLAKAPRKIRGRSNYCSICCNKAGAKAKSMPWDERCIDVDWNTSKLVV